MRSRKKTGKVTLLDNCLILHCAIGCFFATVCIVKICFLNSLSGQGLLSSDLAVHWKYFYGILTFSLPLTTQKLEETLNASAVKILTSHWNLIWKIEGSRNSIVGRSVVVEFYLLGTGRYYIKFCLHILLSYKYLV